MEYLSCEVRETRPGTNADAAVIWLHGLGADGHDFAAIVPELRLPATLAVRFIFPHAPSIPVTINGGMVMPAWYDILEMDVQRRLDEEQLRESARQVHDLVEREIGRGISAQRIVLAGFSQGGAVVLEAGLTFERRLAGILSLSSYFATADSIQPSEANRDLPVRICHGTLDPMVTQSLGRRSADSLTAMGHPVEYSTYTMAHAVCAQEIRDISHWLQSVLPAQ
ncbi:MAG: carboxylesterase [Pseudohongiellaceae bacterium]